MGEAKRKRLAAAAKPDTATLEHMAMAMQKVVGAITSFHGADCLAHALIGAEVLKTLGYDAKAVAGSAAWRVGSGDGDVITHAVELSGGGIGPAFVPNHETMAGMFHAWIEVGMDIVDFTTASLPDKARQLDAIDGGLTAVDWAPDFLWIRKQSISSLQEVVAASGPGVFAYRREANIEVVVFSRMEEFDAIGLAGMVQVAMHALKTGHGLKVIGVDEKGQQDIESARRASLEKGLMATRPIATPHAY